MSSVSPADDDDDGSLKITKEKVLERKGEAPVAPPVKRRLLCRAPQCRGDVLHQKGDQRAVDKKMPLPATPTGGEKSDRTSAPNPSCVPARKVICRISSALFPRPSSLFCSIIFSAAEGWRLILTDGAPCAALSLIFTSPSRPKREEAR